jgi:hypothetical protein
MARSERQMYVETLSWGGGLLGLAPCACVMISTADLIMEIHSITFNASENL